MNQVRRNKINYNKNKDVEETKINVKNFFGFKSIIIYILSILVGTCKLASGATPFGLALLGAITDAKFPLIVPLILISVVTGISFGGTCLLKFILSSLIFIITKSFIKENTRIGNAAKILFATAISETVVLLMSETLIYDAVMAAFMSTTTAIFYLIFSEGLPVILELRERKIDSHETLMAAGILSAVTISGIGDVGLFGLSIRSVICILVVLLLGWKRGATIGIVSGVSISLVLGIMGIADASTVATYAVCGLLSGIFSRYGKLGAVIGFILGNAIWVYHINASTETIIPISEIIVASVALFFMPKRVSNFVDDLFDDENYLEGKDPIGLLAESTIHKLKAVSEVAEDMAENVEKAEKASSDKTGEFIKTLNENTCKKCSKYDECWNKNYHAMYEMIFNSIEILQRKSVIVEDDIKESICQNKVALVEGLNFSFEIYKLNKDWQNKLEENKKLVAKQLRGVSKAIDNVKDDIVFEEKTSDKLLGAGYHLEVGIAKTKKKNSTVSGDTTEYTKLKNGQILLGLSDGMGTGEKAAKSSKKVLQLLEKYLNAGLDKKVAIDLINSYMLLGENKDNYSTLDAIIFNPTDANMMYIKSGACPTYVKQGESVNIMTSKTLPVGAMSNINIELYEKHLDRGDYFVMISDGILEANSNNQDWVKDLLKEINTNKPQRIADIILQEAVDMNYGIANDDMTVIIAKVC